MLEGDLVTGRFEIEASAASGGMGRVYRARDRETGHTVALKVFADPDVGDEARFAQEVEHLSALDHPNIVGYVAHGVTSSGGPFLVMPWLDGIDLQQKLRDGPLDVASTLTIAERVAEALAYLHGRGLVHRDLKPSNLFLPGGSVDDLKVIDLGIARTSVPTQPMTVSGVLVGTPGFMAPEQARGERVIAPAVDIFALGCVLFECLTGSRLFSGSNVMAVLAKILLEEAPRVRELLPSVPESLDLLVHRMVSKDPDKRPRDGAELVGWLKNVGDIPPISTRMHARPVALTGVEQRVVSVLVVVAPRSASDGGPSDTTRSDADPIRATAGRFGVRIQPLADGTTIALAPEGLDAADRASLLVRFGRAVVDAVPGARVALATGSAVTGDRLPFGEAIDRGVKIVRAAGSTRLVHVDDVTAALITARFDIRRIDAQLVVDDERISLDPMRRLLGRPTSCLGREREIATLESTLAACIEGGGPRVVLVTAAAGAGKSRLRHELVRRMTASDDAPRVLHARGNPFHSTTPYTLLAQVVRQAIGAKEADAPADVRARLREHVEQRLPAADVERVREFLGELVGAPFDDDGRVQLRAARHSAPAMADQIGLALEHAVRAWCAERPLLIVLEDLHWADAASVKLVDGVLRKLRGVPLFVLALGRPDVHERFPGLWRHRDVNELRLPPLGERACEKVVREVMGEGVDDDLVSRIVARSEGNAFYLEELIRVAADDDRRRPASRPGRQRDRSDPSLRLGSPNEPGDPLPQSMIAVAQARILRLDTTTRKVLRAASVFGETFWLAGVAALVAEPVSALDASVRALVENEAIVPSDSSRFSGAHALSFRHTLLRAAAYATLTDDDRALGHRLAAQWLESVDEDREVVALHWLEGGERTRAAASFETAGERRWASAHADAAARCMIRALLVSVPSEEGVSPVAARVRRLSSALEAIRGIDDPDVLLGLERHVVLTPREESAWAGWGVVHRALDRAVAGVRELGSVPAEILAQAARALAAVSDFTAAGALLSEATSTLASDDPDATTVRLLSARVALWEGRCGRILELLSNMSVPTAVQEQIDTQLLLATATVATSGARGLARGLEHLAEAERLVAEAGDNPVARVLCQKTRFLCFHFAAEHPKAAEAAEEAVRLARAAGLRYEECVQLHNAGEQYVWVGDAARARAALEASGALALEIGADIAHDTDEALLAYLDARAGDRGATGRLEAIADGLQRAGNVLHELSARYWLGMHLAADGDPAARPSLERALGLARELQIRAHADDCEKALARLGGA